MGMKAAAAVAGVGVAASVSALIFVTSSHTFSTAGHEATTAGQTNKSSRDETAKPPLVVIDPGHGDDDPGARSVYGTAEKDITWQVSTRIAHDLESRGVRVTLTRTENQNPSLSERLSDGLSSHAAFFLSVHANDFDASSDVRGSEIHVFDPSKLTESRYPGTRLSAAAASRSVAISESIVQQLVSHPVGVPVRSGEPKGIRYDVDFVCRLNDGPAGLIELGYLSNPTDARRLTDPHVQDLYAADIANGIANAVLPQSAVASSQGGSTAPNESGASSTSANIQP